MVVLKESVSLRRKAEVTIDEEAKRIADIMVEGMDPSDDVIEEPASELEEGQVMIAETFKVPGTEEILKQGTIISISKE